MSIGKRLRVDFTWVLAGNILYSACQWMIVVVLAKLGTPQQVGEYSLGLAVSAPIILFGNLQLRSLLASDVAERFRFDQYLIFRLLTLGAALAVVVAVAAFWGDTREAKTVIIVVAAAQTIELVSETYYGLMQKHGRMDRISRSLMYRGPLALAAMSIVMYYTHSAVWSLTALALGRLLVFVGWDARFDVLKSGSPLRLRGNWDDQGALLRTALPLGVISMLVALNSNIPRYFVQAHGGSAELGMYSAVASLLSAGSLVVSAYGQALFLPVARACAALDRVGYRKLVLQAAGSGAVLGTASVLVSVFFGEAILARLFRPEYARYTGVLVRLMIAGTITFIASGLGFVITAARSLRPQVPLLLVTGMAAAAASWRLVPKSGLVGAADSVLIAALVQLIGTAVILQRVDRRLQHGDELARVMASEPAEAIEVEAV